MATSSVHKGLGNFSKIFKPLSHESILIDGEVIIYYERQHWAALIQPVMESFSLAILILALATGGTSNRTVTAFLIILGVITAIYYIRSTTFKKYQIYGLAVLGLLIFTTSDISGAALIIVFFLMFRLVNKLMLWTFYQRRYITNRRVISSEGFLNASISTMPLSRVTDLSTDQSFLGSLLDYATLRVETAGQDQALSKINFLKKPDEFYSTLIKLSTQEVDYHKYFEI